MNLNMRNYPPTSGIRLPAEAMQQVITNLFIAVEMPQEDAELMGRILTANDLRCVFSHGTRATCGYVQKILDGDVNPQPQLKVMRESPGALALDGDGGLGYFPCYRGTLKAIEKARTCGVAALTTYNHFHFGAAGNYSRLALAHDCIGMSVSSHRSFLTPQDSIYSTLSSSPISVAIPSGDEPPLVMDMGSSFLGFNEARFNEAPSTFFKALAFGNVVRILGGVFAGIFREEVQPPQSPWDSNQGSFIAVFDVNHFWPLEEVQREMDRFMAEARQTQPLPGMERAELAGGMEAIWERENIVKGIPLSDPHRQDLQEMADKLGIETPFAAYEVSRF